MVMIAAGIVTVLFQRLKQPVVLGYIVAGVLIGPKFSALFLEGDGFKLVHEGETIESLAELGMVFLMFSLGLEFNLRKLGRVAATALVVLLCLFLNLFSRVSDCLQKIPLVAITSCFFVYLVLKATVLSGEMR